MLTPMQIALGDHWQQLPPALQTHYCEGHTRDVGALDIEFPRWMHPCLSLLHLVGALVPRRGKQVATVVDKSVVGERQFWKRKIRFADGQEIRFNSHWESAPDNTLIEYVNPLLGLQMRPEVIAGRLHYQGVRFVVRLGRWRLPIPEWLVLGHTTIVEEAIDEERFRMDFRLTHPLFGEVFRYTGEFRAMRIGEGGAGS